MGRCECGTCAICALFGASDVGSRGGLEPSMGHDVLVVGLPDICDWVAWFHREPVFILYD